MIITLEADTRYGENRFRLQKDNSWRLIQHENCEIKKRDKEFNLDQRDLIAEMIEREGVLLLNGEAYYANSLNEPDGETDVKLYAALHRLVEPRRFSRDELVKIIETGNDSIPNTLVVDIHGRFELVPYADQNPLKEDLSYAVMHPEFIPNENNLGKNAIANKDYLELLFLSSVVGWKDHLFYRTFPIVLGEEDYDIDSISEKEAWESIKTIFLD